MDDTDRHLLSLLQADARESAALLGRKLGLARTTVVARIARLERDGVIAGYGVRLGRRLEQAAVRAYCGLRVAPKSGAAVVRALERWPEVEEISAVSGEFDYVAWIRADSPNALDRLLDEIGETEGVSKTTTSVVLAERINRG